MNHTRHSVGVFDTTSRSISKCLKSVSNQVQILNRKWIKKKFSDSDSEVFSRMTTIANRITEIQEELISIGLLLDEDVETEHVIIPDNVTITGKEFVLLNSVFAQYMSDLGCAKIER